MPLPLTKFSPSDPFTSANGWKIPIPFTSLNSLAIINNQSNTEFDVFTDYGDYLGTVPAGVLFIPILIGYSTLYLEFRGGDVVNTLSIPTNYVNGMIYSPNENKPNIQPVALARSVNIGNNVTVGTSDILEGTGQVSGFTTQDVSSVPNVYPGLRPATKANNGTTPIYLMALDNSGNPLVGSAFIIDTNLTTCSEPLKLLQGLSQVGNAVTAGALGVSTVIGNSGPTNIINTGLNNILVVTPLVSGFYRANAHMLINNGTSGNAVTLQLTYNDANNITRTVFFVGASGSTFLTAAGVTAFGNTSFACEPLCIYASNTGNITIAYKDPTNTPNDIINAVIERLT